MPLLRATSRETVEVGRPKLAAIAVNVHPAASPREMASRSSNDNRNAGLGRRRRGRTPPDWASQ
jgi:hypothetical protein